jgi:hypothetical protein
MATPASVPPVPTAETKPSTLPPVCAQISCAVVRMWPSRFATLSNWFAQIAPFSARLRQLLGQAARHFHVVVRVLVGHGRHLDQFGAEQAQRVLLFLALRVGDDDDGAVAQRLGDHGQADAGIAGGALDDDAAGPEQALLLGVADDEQPGAVLHRLAGIHELGLAEDLAAGRFGSLAQADQRR